MTMRKLWPIGTLLLAVTLPAVSAHAQSGYDIMVPERGAKPDKYEPWLAPKYKSPRGTRQHVVIPRAAPAPRLRSALPPPLVAPNGQALPNLPAVAPSGPHGSETYQDRAVRCAHQAGVYGDTTGNRTAYLGNCVNQ